MAELLFSKLRPAGFIAKQMKDTGLAGTPDMRGGNDLNLFGMLFWTMDISSE